MSNTRKYLAVAAALTLAGSAVGCDWRSFDDLADEAWSQSSGSPSSLNAGEYATSVATSGSGDGVKFLVTAQRPVSVAMVSYDNAGALTTGGEKIDSTTAGNLDALPSRPPMAGDPDSAAGMVAIGGSENTGTSGKVLVYNSEGPGLKQTIPLGAKVVSALAIGATNNPDNMQDLVATTGDLLSVVSNYSEMTGVRKSCTFARARGFSIAISEFDTGSTEDEIAMAIGNENQDGAASSVLILSGATVVAAAEDMSDQSCIANGRTALGELTAPGGEGDFGAAMVAGDFDGGGGMDLAVSAPSSNKVYVYMNIDLTGGAPAAPIEVNGPAGSVQFGETLAAGDFDGDGSDELVVADTRITVGGASNAGRVYVIPSDGDFGTRFTLGDVDPDSDQSFGRGLSVGTFGSGGLVLAVAARNELFTFFRTHISSDVRR